MRLYSSSATASRSAKRHARLHRPIDSALSGRYHLNTVTTAPRRGSQSRARSSEKRTGAQNKLLTASKSLIGLLGAQLSSGSSDKFYRTS